ncbi:SUMO-specific isopeptidase USPL1 isoform 1-T2 [Pholidichthys leucotaenia]
MVICCRWPRTAVELNSSSNVPMTGEDTGLEALASPLVGYLGKVQQRGASLTLCPWCSSKGLTYALRSYHINLQESVTLCTNPQCLFPLVTRPLEDILASLNPVEPSIGSKRKGATTLKEDEVIKPKRLRSSSPDDLGPQNVIGTFVDQAENGDVGVESLRTDGEKINGCPTDGPGSEVTGRDSLEPDASVAEVLTPKCPTSVEYSSEVPSPADVPAHTHHGTLGVSETDLHSADISFPSASCCEPTECAEEKSPAADVPKCKDTSETVDLSFPSQSEELVHLPDHLLWGNIDNLCWLDSLLAALVNCRNLKCKPEDEPERSSVWQLMTRYDDICGAVHTHKQAGNDGIVRVPKHILQKATAELESLRMSVFQQLQPKLRCKLGQRETPVFAMPLLLMNDSWVEHLFQSTFEWEFKCKECKAFKKLRVMKTLPTCTNISPDWHPLKAVHFAPCNMCHRKNQMRTMVLEDLSPVFALHFVEGLPDSDVHIYAFNFNGEDYSVTTVIQYKYHLKHFVTWIYNADGSWLEYDDLKHPHYKIHQKFLVPPHEIHVVFWEKEEPQLHSPSQTLVKFSVSKNGKIPSLNDSTEDKLPSCTANQSLLVPHNDSDIICAHSTSAGSSTDPAVTDDADGSISDNTLMETFEGLTHKDIVTLTLEELNPDMEPHPVNENYSSEDLGGHSRNEKLGSSTPVKGNTHDGSDIELPTTSSSPESDASSKDPSYMPGRKGPQGRGTRRRKTTSKRNIKKAVPRKSISEPSKPLEEICDKPVGSNPPQSAVEFAQRSRVSSTEPSAPSALDQKTSWHVLHSRHLLQQVQKSAPKIPPISVQQGKPTPPNHSALSSMEVQPVPEVFLFQPQLRTEETDGVLMKAAVMYGAFGSKSLGTKTQLPPPALLKGKSLPSPPFSPVSAVLSVSLPGAKKSTEASPSKKHTSNFPPDLTSTDALRYKLIKKLKAKKKKLDRLNKLLGGQGIVAKRADSTELDSPSTVTSSTCGDSTCDDFLSDLLSPATTASNLSPDSTGLLEMLTNGQDGSNQVDKMVGDVAAAAEPQTHVPNNADFLEEFFFQAAAQRQTDVETEALNALELFI